MSLLARVPCAQVELGPLEEPVETLANRLTQPLSLPDDAETEDLEHAAMIIGARLE